MCMPGIGRQAEPHAACAPSCNGAGHPVNPGTVALSTVPGVVFDCKEATYAWRQDPRPNPQGPAHRHGRNQAAGQVPSLRSGLALWSPQGPSPYAASRMTLRRYLPATKGRGTMETAAERKAGYVSIVFPCPCFNCGRSIDTNDEKQIEVPAWRRAKDGRTEKPPARVFCGRCRRKFPRLTRES